MKGAFDLLIDLQKSFRDNGIESMCPLDGSAFLGFRNGEFVCNSFAITWSQNQDEDEKESADESHEYEIVVDRGNDGIVGLFMRRIGEDKSDGK